MSSDGELELKDSRNVTGAGHTPDGRWNNETKEKAGHGGEYEPQDSRNVTGAASTADGRWTNEDGNPDETSTDLQDAQEASERPEEN